LLAADCPSNVLQMSVNKFPKPRIWTALITISVNKIRFGLGYSAECPYDRILVESNFFLFANILQAFIASVISSIISTLIIEFSFRDEFIP
jgi:hypothetical protein